MDTLPPELVYRVIRAIAYYRDRQEAALVSREWREHVRALRRNRDDWADQLRVSTTYEQGWLITHGMATSSRWEWSITREPPPHVVINSLADMKAFLSSYPRWPSCLGVCGGDWWVYVMYPTAPCAAFGEALRHRPFVPAAASHLFPMAVDLHTSAGDCSIHISRPSPDRSACVLTWPGDSVRIYMRFLESTSMTFACMADYIRVLLHLVAQNYRAPPPATIGERLLGLFTTSRDVALREAVAAFSAARLDALLTYEPYLRQLPALGAMS